MRRNYNEDGKDTPFADISYFSLAGKNEFFNALTKPVAVLKIGEEYYILLTSILLVSSIFQQKVFRVSGRKDAYDWKTGRIKAVRKILQQFQV